MKYLYITGEHENTGEIFSKSYVPQEVFDMMEQEGTRTKYLKVGGVTIEVRSRDIDNGNPFCQWARANRAKNEAAKRTRTIILGE